MLHIDAMPHDDLASRTPTTLLTILGARAEADAKGGYAYLADGESIAEALNWKELHERVVSLSGTIRRHGASGDRALLVFPPGLDFVVAFLSCLHAGVIAVPCLPPRRPLIRAIERITGVSKVAEPSLILTTGAPAGMIQELRGRIAELATCQIVDTRDAQVHGATERESVARPAGIAFLQFTSGSTASPKGVSVTHANLLHNLGCIRQLLGKSPDSVSVSWLPAYHDMGLIDGILAPLFDGYQSYLMPPQAFLQRPIRWLRAISRYRATHSGAPNFAYDLCTARVTAAELDALDLASWSAAYNGAEPIRASTLDAFSERFAPARFRREALIPCYGLAEATLMVSGGRVSEVTTLSIDALALENGHVLDAAPGQPSSRAVVSCGRTGRDIRACCVDYETGACVPDNQIGEIWVSGPSIANGYFRETEATRATFEKRLTHEPNLAFLRTGDLGFTRAGELYVTGRLKDLIILSGRNLYPQDIEWTAEVVLNASGATGSGAVAFAIELDGREAMVVLVEAPAQLAWNSTGPFGDTTTAAIARGVAREHQVLPARTALVPVGALLKTSSGKIRRAACRRAYLAGELKVLEEHRLDEQLAHGSEV